MSFKSQRRAKRLVQDPVNPSDFMHLNMTFCCEQCTHFDDQSPKCTLGFPHRPHLRKNQLELYNLTGRMIFCRSLEID
ncbi:MAG: hypothetical protein CL675_12565 [Bdellovibrionaceae bacterium]|nr:hypothetical protein [Pseudobdellovibrionaceae bacterium]